MRVRSEINKNKHKLTEKSGDEIRKKTISAQ